MAEISLWYTVLALSEMDSAEARTELKYAAAALMLRLAVLCRQGFMHDAGTSWRFGR
jgi:hypothetical protein